MKNIHGSDVPKPLSCDFFVTVGTQKGATVKVLEYISVSFCKHSHEIVFHRKIHLFYSNIISCKSQIYVSYFVYFSDLKTIHNYFITIILKKIHTIGWLDSSIFFAFINLGTTARKVKRSAVDIVPWKNKIKAAYNYILKIDNMFPITQDAD